MEIFWGIELKLTILPKHKIRRKYESKRCGYSPDGIEFDAETNEFFDELEDQFFKGQLNFQKINTHAKGRVVQGLKAKQEQKSFTQKERNEFLRKCGIKIGKWN